MYIKAPNETSAKPVQCHEDIATHWRKPQRYREVLRIKEGTMGYWER